MSLKEFNINIQMINSFSCIAKVLCDKYDMKPEEAFSLIINSQMPKIFRKDASMFKSEFNEKWAEILYKQSIEEKKNHESNLILKPGDL